MNKKDIEAASKIVKEFSDNARPCDLFQEVQKKILKESEKNLIDDYWVRYNQDWSILGHQVMGAEVF
jgi:hypothetical protein